MSEPKTVLDNPRQAGGVHEQDLIARVQRGEHDLFYELVRPYERRVYAAALAILRNEADAEDAAQEAMLKALANIRQFRAEARFSTWLIQITVNEALMRRRRERTVVMEGIDDQRDEEGEYVPRDFADWREIPSEALERKEIRQRLAEALADPRPKVSRGIHAARHGAPQHSGNSGDAGDFRCRGKNAAVAGAAHAARSAGRRMGAGLVQPLAVREGEQAMVVNCEQVWREISNYLEGGVDPALRSAIEEHFGTCTRCKSVLEGTRNVVTLYGDERMLEVPAGFSRRLEKRLVQNARAGKAGWSTWSAWLVPVAAMALMAGAVQVASSSYVPPSFEVRTRAAWDTTFLQTCRFWLPPIPEHSTWPAALSSTTRAACGV